MHAACVHTPAVIVASNLFRPQRDFFFCIDKKTKQMNRSQIGSTARLVSKF